MSEEKEVLLGFLIGSISILRDMNIQFTEKSRNKLADKIMELLIPCYGRKGTIEFMLNDTLLNLIEKQQKEIEELKKYEKYYEEMEEVNKKFIAVDKIKAKIEEYKKQQKEEPDAYLCIKVLSSLLEKE